ncbi:MAG: thioredoxin family protein [Planctomycetota bacterium]|nr:thioredoxin family protein [Planctomycetota bacterium]
MAFTLSLGAAAPDFRLPGVDGKNYSLADFKEAKALIVVFSCNHCPFVVGSVERMKKLVVDYAPRGVRMVAINSNETEKHPADSFEHMKTNAKEKGLNFPYVRDDSQDVARAYGALRTPHFYVFDAARKLAYTGRMDDNPREPGKETTHELRDALDAVLAGKAPAVALTNPVGCNVKWAGKDGHWMPAEACDLVPRKA